jgi:arabinose-5-phosphate isomerase
MQKTSLQEIAKNTLTLEANSILEVREFINEEFEKVIQLILQSKGRLVISGIGKSAIIGQKIVATLNSTGTPSIFMHAADAIHGDLGMIREEDVVMIISKSGESPEIRVLVTLIQNLGNPLIAMVGKIPSALAEGASYILNTNTYLWELTPEYANAKPETPINGKDFWAFVEEKREWVYVDDLIPPTEENNP